MNKTIYTDVEIEITPTDLLEYLVGTDHVEQGEFIYKLSCYHNKYVSSFSMQLRYIVDYLKEKYDEDDLRQIKRMIDDIYSYLGEVDE
jgi:hypothetical protein